MNIIVWIVLAALAGWFVVFVVVILRLFWALVRPPQLPRTTGQMLADDPSAEDEGNWHSGPFGYSPMTPYPQTQYGSLFNPDALWAERTGYDRTHRSASRQHTAADRFEPFGDAYSDASEYGDDWNDERHV